MKNRNALRNGAGIAAAALAGALALGAAGAAAQSSRTNQATETVAAAGVVNINSATAAELQRLPGIGPSKAQAIVAHRNRVRRFRRVEDLMRVRGIGRATFRRLRPMLVLQGDTTLAAPAASRQSQR